MKEIFSTVSSCQAPNAANKIKTLEAKREREKNIHQGKWKRIMLSVPVRSVDRTHRIDVKKGAC